MSEHRAVSAHEILDRPTQNVVESGTTICGRRSFVEDKTFTVRVLGQRLAKKVFVAPALEDVLFDSKQVAGKFGITHMGYNN